ncbi:MAG: hypothetical protein WC691_00830 [Sulfuricurvum sp.]
MNIAAITQMALFHPSMSAISVPTIKNKPKNAASLFDPASSNRTGSLNIFCNSLAILKMGLSIL